MKTFKLGDRIVDPLAGTIEVPGKGSTRIEPRSMQVLMRLVAQGEGITTRDALFEDVWGGRAVSDDVLTGSISILRKTLGDSARSPRFIQTVTGEGYRIVAPVGELPSEAPARRLAKPLLIAACALVFGGIVFFSTGFWPRSPEPPEDPLRIAVLPFENLSDSRPLDHLAAGITDGIITELARRGELQVLSRTSILRFAGSDVSLASIAEELGSDLIIEGAVLPLGDDLRVSAQLIDGKTDAHLWADELVRPLSDLHGMIFDLSATIGSRVATVSGPDPLPVQALEDSRARDAFWHARHLLDRPMPGDLSRARELLTLALELEPDFARAHLERARLAYSELELGHDAERALSEMRSAAWRATELMPSLPGGSAYLAIHALVADQDFEAAERWLDAAIRSTPSDAMARAWLANLYLITGRLDDAARELQIVDLLDPDPASYAGRSFLLYLAAQKKLAKERLERLLRNRDVHPMTHLVAARVFAAEGDEARALDHLQSGYRLLGRRDEPPWDEGIQSVQRWRIRAWEARRQAGEAVSLSSLAALYASIGERDRALVLLAEAKERRELLALFSDLWPEL